jgi:hypothetical protein
VSKLKSLRKKEHHDKGKEPEVPTSRPRAKKGNQAKLSTGSQQLSAPGRKRIAQTKLGVRRAESPTARSGVNEVLNNQEDRRNKVLPNGHVTQPTDAQIRLRNTSREPPQRFDSVRVTERDQPENRVEEGKEIGEPGARDETVSGSRGQLTPQEQHLVTDPSPSIAVQPKDKEAVMPRFEHPLLSWTFLRSAKVVQVPESKKEEKMLAEFSEHLAGVTNQGNILGDTGRYLDLDPHLVVIHDKNAVDMDTREKFICLRVERQDIPRVHAALVSGSKSNSWVGLRFCYDTTQSPICISGYDLEYEIKHYARNSHSLCGKLLRTKYDGEEWISTIGGVLRVDGSLYAITTSHRPERRQYPGSGNVTDNTEIRWEDLPGPPGVIIENEKDTKTPQSELNLRNGDSRPSDAGSSSWGKLLDTGETREALDFDWRLIPLAGSDQLPNYYQTCETLEPSQSSSKPIINYAHGRFLLAQTRQSFPSRVHIMAGISGLVSGTISDSFTYLITGKSNAPLRVWTVELDEGQGQYLFYILAVA